MKKHFEKDDEHACGPYALDVFLKTMEILGVKSGKAVDYYDSSQLTRSGKGSQKTTLAQTVSGEG